MPNKKPNALLATVATKAANDLVALITEGEDEIIKAIHSTSEEAQLQESKPKFTLSFKITLDLDSSTYTNALSWSVKRSLETSHQLEDEHQEKLNL